MDHDDSTPDRSTTTSHTPGDPPASETPAQDLPPLGTIQSRAEVLSCAGSRTARAVALRAAGGGPIVGLALTMARNPDAPSTIVVGAGARPAREAVEMVAAGVALPVWVRGRSSTGWRYTGRWLPTVFDTSAAGVGAAGHASREGSEDPPPLGVLRLDPFGPVDEDL